MVSFQKAVDCGVDLIELDVQSTADGEIVVFHDPAVDRTTNGRGNLAGMRFADLRNLDAGWQFSPPAFPFRGRGITVPSLEEVLSRFPDVGFTVEIKSSPHAFFLPNLMSILRRNSPERIIVAAEDHPPLARIRKEMPDLATNFSRPEVRWFYFLAKMHLAFFFRSPGTVFQVPVYAKGDERGGLRVVTRGFIQAAHAQGRAVQVWTINDPARMRDLIDLGVDGLTTDRPDILNHVRGA